MAGKLISVENINFNAPHSPMGAFMSFTAGHFGTLGGIGTQIGKPGNQEVYVGVKNGRRFESSPLQCLPFFTPKRNDETWIANFLVEQLDSAGKKDPGRHVNAYTKDQIRREYGWATDRWITEDFTFSVYTPFGSIPDPTVALPSQMRSSLLPAVVAELEVDNRFGTESKTAFFALNVSERGWRSIDPLSTARRGFAVRHEMGVMGEIINKGIGDALVPDLFCRWTPHEGIREPAAHLLGSCPGLLVEVPPGEHRVLRLAIGCYIGGIVTSGLAGRYLYTSYFSSLADVLEVALSKGDPRPASDALDERLLESGLSTDQQFLISHATRGYYANTQLLEVGGQPFWVVNEGEYCMMNTLDLCVDHMFWELDQNPWVVRNLLDNFVRHYSYVDSLKSPHSDEIVSGGISFCHDMGAHNIFSPPGHSSYELPNLNAVCFSYMTAEQLCNWILMATTYVMQAGDMNWARQNDHVLYACAESLHRRSGIGGIPEFDSTRCGSGAEITTYDSLDPSLSQTRDSLYMAVKFWAAWLGLGTVFERLKNATQEERAFAMAKRIVQTLGSKADADGALPAIFEKQSNGYHSRILPACEGLLYPYVWGINLATESPELYDLLKKHVLVLLEDPQRRNLFPDGGIRLSSTSENSWLSKIALFQEVAKQVFHLHEDPMIASLFAEADRAHVNWQVKGSSYWGCSDQFVRGIAKGSRWYPRNITAALWLAPRDNTTARTLKSGRLRAMKGLPIHRAIR
jgi:xylan 1,4-beta-xylosidase